MGQVEYEIQKYIIGVYTQIDGLFQSKMEVLKPVIESIHTLAIFQI